MDTDGGGWTVPQMPARETTRIASPTAVIVAHPPLEGEGSSKLHVFLVDFQATSSLLSTAHSRWPGGEKYKLVLGVSVGGSAGERLLGAGWPEWELVSRENLALSPPVTLGPPLPQSSFSICGVYTSICVSGQRGALAFGKQCLLHSELSGQG
uniref:uncharacterized protein FCN1 n=1 Tax=Callithrix jacchus TaxID=9483 RepID=UPI0023DD3922|nr:uncharacterized protein FCN1 [Callithrix jacchus]